MSPRLLFVPPESKHPIEVGFSQNYKRLLKVYEMNHLKVEEPEFHEKRQMRHWVHRSIANPEHIKTQIIRIYRTKIRQGEFEDDQSNIITGPKAPEEGLHYVLHEIIDDPKAMEQGNPPWSFPLSDDTFEVGRYDRPKFNLKLDKRGDLKNSTVVGGFKCWYTEYTPDKAKEILSQFEKGDTFQMMVQESSHTFSPRSVFNEKEWLQGDIDELLLANKDSFLLKDGSYGGLNRWKKEHAKKIKEGEGTETTTKKRQYTKPPEEDNAAS